MTFLSIVKFMFWNYNVLKLLPLETITFSDATLSDINVVLCYVLSPYDRALIHKANANPNPGKTDRLVSS